MAKLPGLSRNQSPGQEVGIVLKYRGQTLAGSCQVSILVFPFKDFAVHFPTTATTFVKRAAVALRSLRILNLSKHRLCHVDETWHGRGRCQLLPDMSGMVVRMRRLMATPRGWCAHLANNLCSFPIISFSKPRKKPRERWTRRQNWPTMSFCCLWKIKSYILLFDVICVALVAILPTPPLFVYVTITTSPNLVPSTSPFKPKERSWEQGCTWKSHLIRVIFPRFEQITCNCW